VDRVRSDTDGRATDALLTDTGLKTLRAAAPKHVAWVRKLFFSDLDDDRVVELGDLLDEVYRTILREGTLPTPD
jgi:DNA-binding MarR family transcriptional regulator